MKITIANHNVVNPDMVSVDSYTVFRAFFNNDKEYIQLVNILQQAIVGIKNAIENKEMPRRLEIKVDKNKKIVKSQKKIKGE